MASCSTAPTSIGQIIPQAFSASAKQQHSLFDHVCCCPVLQVVQPPGTKFPAAVHRSLLEQGVCSVRLLSMCHLLFAMHDTADIA